VTGLPERSDIDDRAAFVQLCETWLPFKPALSEGSCRRVGEEESGRPRRLLIHLGSEETATQLLQAAPRLRRVDDDYIAHNVYFNPDLSRAANRLAYEQRQLRRESRLKRTRGLIHVGNEERATEAIVSAVSATEEVAAAAVQSEQSVNAQPTTGSSFLCS
jgi:hypothetical protein